jgi:GNAT superfamily N-acetyltransferase
MSPERGAESIALGDGGAKSPTGHVAFDDMHFVEPIQPDRKALVRLYRELLVPNFCSDQLATEEAFVADQRSEGSRTILAWDSKGDLVGGLTGHYYATCRVYLLGYLAVSHRFRGKGIGSALLGYGLDRWSQKLAPTLILGELTGVGLDRRHGVSWQMVGMVEQAGGGWGRSTSWPPGDDASAGSCVA